MVHVDSASISTKNVSQTNLRFASIDSIPWRLEPCLGIIWDADIQNYSSNMDYRYNSRVYLI